MTSGRLEKETAEFKKIEEKLNALPSVIVEYYYTMRAEKKSYATIDRYINSIKSFMEYVTNGKTMRISIKMLMLWILTSL